MILLKLAFVLAGVVTLAWQFPDHFPTLHNMLANTVAHASLPDINRALSVAQR